MIAEETVGMERHQVLPDLASLRALLRDCAREELLPRFADVRRQVKPDGSLVTEADIAMQRRMQQELTRRWPRYAFLGEEMSAVEHERLAALSEPGLWCLDPLDGTSNYAAGVPFFMEVSVRNFGKTALKDVPVLLEEDGHARPARGEPLRPATDHVVKDRPLGPARAGAEPVGGSASAAATAARTSSMSCWSP